ncbi:threonine--tRNA ligase [Pyrofollis japonicus]|uniref:threonine--tRNA ligase n=1 Tax=Pyrofollis japonicus TaxID=3060460 RepID=UPI0037C74A35|nr:threonine--tRNA ligase [Pyrofollis japonicus]
MKVLLIHAKEFYYRARSKAISDAEPLSEAPESLHLSNALIAFTTVEDVDAQAPKDVAKKAALDIDELARQLKVENVLIYPYAHLSSKLAPPHIALNVLKLLQDELEAISERAYNVYRAPFGWYKEFKVHCLGHPLSELSRSYTPQAIVRPKVEKRYYILTPEGEVYDPQDYLSRASKELQILIEKEALGKEIGEVKNPVNEVCSKFGFEWEPMGDYGHMRYEPHASLIVDAVSEYAWALARSLGIPVLKVRGTNMFDLASKPVYEHAQLYGDRLYELWTDRKHLVLRYAACHQQFAMLKDYVLSYKDLPLGMFEVADSYRLEQSGEVTLCFRLRRFYMPDLHILTKDIEEAVKISEKLQEVIHREARKLGQEYYAVYNVTEDFWEQKRDMLLELIRRDGKPALITLYPAGIYYWVVNVEYHIIDSAGRPREIATYQFDIGNAKRFGIKYVDENNEERYPVIIHTALIGSVERYIYMVFDSAIKAEKRGETPYIPTWLSPIQVRLIPLNPKENEQMSYAEKVADLLEENMIRVDIDDRDISLGRRIRDAAREWIPYIAVIGERELKTGTLNVTIRKTNDRITMKPEDLVQKLLEEIKGYPRAQPTLPRYVSKRPSLVYLEKKIAV